MTIEAVGKSWRPYLTGIVAVVLIIGVLSLPSGRAVVGRMLRSLRMQKVQAVNVDLSASTDPNANPTLHQMFTQMVSDKVVVTANEPDQPATDASSATQLAGFPVKLLNGRKDAPKLVVSGQHAMNLTVDRARLQTIFSQAGHPDLSLPQSLDGAVVSVQIPRAVNAQYGTCPGPTSATSAIASNITGPSGASTQYADCVRFRQSPSPAVNVPAGLDVEQLAEIGLEVAGMNPGQAHEFFQTVDWKSTLSMTVPRFLRSYQAVKVAGAQGTLLTQAGRRGPGYTLIWAKNGMVYSLVGFGDSSQAIALADSLK